MSLFTNKFKDKSADAHILFVVPRFAEGGQEPAARIRVTVSECRIGGFPGIAIAWGPAASYSHPAEILFMLLYLHNFPDDW